MKLSTSSVSKIADAIRKDVILKIYENEKYAEVMQDLIPSAIDSLMGEMDDELLFDLSMILFDRIELK